MTPHPPPPPPRVLVLMGGPDRERDVSIMSGRAIAAALRKAGLRASEQIIETVDASELRHAIAEHPADVIFPALHGAQGEGGPLQERLEVIGLPYVGSGPRAAAVAMDKDLTKRIIATAGCQTPDAAVVDSGRSCPIAPPLVLKPVDDGSSFDLRICRTIADVEDARRTLHARRGRLLAERYIDGRELTVGLLHDRVLPIIEIEPTVEFYDYEAKYERDDTRYVIEPDLPDGVARACREAALHVFRQIGARDLARVDFMLDADGPWFLEINTMPGFTDHSLVPMAARHAGLEMPDLCAGLVTAAAARGAGWAEGHVDGPVGPEDAAVSQARAGLPVDGA